VFRRVLRISLWPFKSNNILSHRHATLKALSFARYCQRAVTENHPIDELYSGLALETWRKILHKDMHYHFGECNEDGKDIFEQAVRSLYEYIQPGSSILDCGCGWGGPAKMLIRENGCNVEGITISKQQYDSISEFKVFHEDLCEFQPKRLYDVALFMESYTHLADAPLVLQRIAPSVRSILIKDFVSDNTFYDQDWQMTIRTRQRFVDELEGSKLFAIREMREFNDDGIRAACAYWFKNLLMLDENERIAHASLLWELCIAIGLGRNQENAEPAKPSVRSVLIYAEQTYF